jgi:hypothetical protein
MDLESCVLISFIIFAFTVGGSKLKMGNCLIPLNYDLTF